MSIDERDSRHGVGAAARPRKPENGSHVAGRGRVDDLPRRALVHATASSESIATWGATATASATHGDATASLPGRWLSAAKRALPTTAVLVCVAMGLVSLAVTNEASRLGDQWTPTVLLYWLGLLSIFVPVAWRSLAVGVTAFESLTLIVVLGTALYAAKILGSPSAFTYGDEFIHIRSTQDILNSQHLFGNNPLLSTAPYYPGMAALTAATVSLTGLSVFVAGLLVIGVARVIISATFFLVALRVTGSVRGASLAGLIYASNPLFLAWGSLFTYENYALPMAAFVVWWVARTRQQMRPWHAGVAVIAVGAVVITHHIASFALSAILLAWVIAETISRRYDPVALRRLAAVAAFCISATATWFFVVAKPAFQYIVRDNIYPGLQESASLISGSGEARELYQSGGLKTPAWEPFASFAAVGLLMMCLMVIAPTAWRLRHRPAILLAALVAASYPLSLLPRLTPVGAGLSARSSEYVFFGLGLTIGLLHSAHSAGVPTETSSLFRLVNEIQRHARAWMIPITAVIFVGNVIIGTPSYARLPPSPRSTEFGWTPSAGVIKASAWARDNLGSNRRFGAGMIDSVALATYGNQDVVAKEEISSVFFASTIDAQVVADLKAQGVEYLLINWAMTQRLPSTPGYYFDPYEPGAGQYRQPFPARSLRKFLDNDCLRTVYDSGEIQIVATSRLVNDACS